MSIKDNQDSARRSWKLAKRRCLDPNHEHYSRYGGRGISMCRKWLMSFDAFIADMGPKPNGTTIERIDNNGNYEPGNCKWATRKEQSNNRSTNKLVTLNGITQTVAQWCDALGVPHAAVRSRIRAGWTAERVFQERVKDNGMPITFDGKSLTLSQWAERLQVPYQVLAYRIREGWGVEKAFKTPFTGRQKLSESQVSEIRAKLQLGESQTAIAELYGVSPSNISRISTQNIHKTL